jgi:D-glycero-D-manno-heptose 1,7-bisphosphate phosphatase
MSLKKTKAIFLDRDGIINVDSGYVSKIEDFVFTKGIFKTLRALQEEGYLLIVVTNQSGIARGYYSEETYMDLTVYMVEELKKRGIRIASVYHCPHGPDDHCKCRKPRAGMLKAAQKQFRVEMKESWMVGDKESDMLAGKNAGIKRRLLVAEKASESATHHVQSIQKVLEIIVS